MGTFLSPVNYWEALIRFIFVNPAGKFRGTVFQRYSIIKNPFLETPKKDF